MVTSLLEQVVADKPDQSSRRGWDLVINHLKVHQEFKGLRERTAREKTLDVINRWNRRNLGNIGNESPSEKDDSSQYDDILCENIMSLWKEKDEDNNLLPKVEKDQLTETSNKVKQEKRQSKHYKQAKEQARQEIIDQIQSLANSSDKDKGKRFIFSKGMVTDLLYQVVADKPDEHSRKGWDIVVHNLKSLPEFHGLRERTARDKTIDVLKKWKIRHTGVDTTHFNSGSVIDGQASLEDVLCQDINQMWYGTSEVASAEQQAEAETQKSEAEQDLSTTGDTDEKVKRGKSPVRIGSCSPERKRKKPNTKD